MFYPLPADTVFEAKERNRRATFFLLGSLIFLYVFFFDLLALAVYIWLSSTARHLPSDFATVLGWSSGLALAAALVHFYFARNSSLDSLLSQVGARDADPADQLHSTFIHVVEEASAAIGAPGVRAVVLSAAGLNAFSMEDGRGQKAIGITEGLLAKLNRGELSAVVAHEAAHLLHEDSKLVTTACFLFSLFGAFRAFLSGALNMSSSSGGQRRRGDASLFVIVILWLISSIGYLVTKLIFMAVSREREYLADADGAQMCKDPLALAESLYKISNRYRGGLSDTFSALFIVNPQESQLDEGEGWFSNLFSTHPPMGKRLKKLLDWAKSDLASLQALDAREEKDETPAAAPPANGSAASFMAYQGGQWTGPFTPDQMFSAGLLIPGNWVCPSGSQEVAQVSQTPVLLSFLQAASGSPAGADLCPRCKVALTEAQYEGAEILKCGFCRGTLLKAGVLERLISRDSRAFSPEEIQKARVWRAAQKGSIADRDHFPAIHCPYCQNHMGKFVYSLLTQVIIDRCMNEDCGAVWCDGGELEMIQTLVEEAHSTKA